MIELLNTKGAAWMDDPRRPCLPTAPVTHSVQFGAHADAWYPTVHHGDKQVQRLCAPCPVRTECLTYALENDEEGIWGGTNEDGRKRLKKKKAAA